MTALRTLRALHALLVLCAACPRTRLVTRQLGVAIGSSSVTRPPACTLPRPPPPARGARRRHRAAGRRRPSPLAFHLIVHPGPCRARLSPLQLRAGQAGLHTLRQGAGAAAGRGGLGGQGLQPAPGCVRACTWRGRAQGKLQPCCEAGGGCLSTCGPAGLGRSRGPHPAPQPARPPACTGVIQTNLYRHMGGFASGLLNLVGGLFMKSIPQGAATTIYAATAGEAALVRAPGVGWVAG